MTDLGTYVCEACKQKFGKTISDERAEAEYVRDFPGMNEERSVVCDECYKKIMAWAFSEGVSGN